MKTKTVLLWAIILFFVDQVIKVVIDRYFLEVNFDIIPPLFYFKPTFNDKYSWINGLFHLGMGFWAHVVLLCLAAVILIIMYIFLKKASGNAKMVNITFIFGFAGMFCGLIGTICWGGCLDYIYLKPLFVFDLKDLYIDTFVILLLLYYYKNKAYLSSIKFKDIFSSFKRFLNLPTTKPSTKN